jgi:hypothetical protein
MLRIMDKDDYKVKGYRTLNQIIERQSPRITCPDCGYTDYIGCGTMEFTVNREAAEATCCNCGSTFMFQERYYCLECVKKQHPEIENIEDYKALIFDYYATDYPEWACGYHSTDSLRVIRQIYSYEGDDRLYSYTITMQDDLYHADCNFNDFDTLAEFELDLEANYDKVIALINNAELPKGVEDIRGKFIGDEPALIYACKDEDGNWIYVGVE